MRGHLRSLWDDGSFVAWWQCSYTEIEWFSNYFGSKTFDERLEVMCEKTQGWSKGFWILILKDHGRAISWGSTQKRERVQGRQVDAWGRWYGLAWYMLSLRNLSDIYLQVWRRQLNKQIKRTTSSKNTDFREERQRRKCGKDSEFL